MISDLLGWVLLVAIGYILGSGTFLAVVSLYERWTGRDEQ